MNVLLPGNESPLRLTLLLSLTNISSESVIKALTVHLVNGMPDAAAAALYGVEKSNFSRALTALNDKAQIVEQIKELDWEHLHTLKKVIG